MRRARKARQKKAMECIGRSRGGPSTKIHAPCDALGNPTGFHPTPGQACDLDGAEVLNDGIAAGTLIADKGYDAHARVIERLEARRWHRQNRTEKSLACMTKRSTNHVI